MLLDESKLLGHGRKAIAPISDVSLVLADGIGPEERERLATLDATVHLTSASAPVDGVDARCAGAGRADGAPRRLS